MKVLIVGLPYFSNDLSRGLSKLYPNHQFISLNTYYSKKDQLKYLYHIFNADIIHSINGTLDKSKVLQLAIKLKKRIIFHWVGTDLYTAKYQFEKQQYNSKYITYPIHLTDSPWFVDPLKKMGIDAKFVPIKGFEKKYLVSNFEKPFSVLSYLSQTNAQFYGMDMLIDIALQTPDINYNLVGIESYDKPIPANIKMHGWVEDIEKWIKKSVVCLRMPKTDGLSFFVLESLAAQRYVAYNQDFQYSDTRTTTKEFVEYIIDKKNKFDNDKLALNSQVAEQVTAEFAQEKVYKEIMDWYIKSLM